MSWRRPVCIYIHNMFVFTRCVAMGTCMTCSVEVKSVDKFNVFGDSSEPLETGTTSEEAWYIRGVLDFCSILCQIMRALIDVPIALQWKRSHLLDTKHLKF